MLQVYGVKFPSNPKPLKGFGAYFELKYQPTEEIQNIYKTGKIKTETGKFKKLEYTLDPYDGYYIYEIIKENKFKNILEIGMGNGMSSLYICSALDELSKSSKMFHLTSIDPFQKIDWENAGLQTLKDAGFSKYHTLIEEVDYLALPNLLKETDQNKISKFDLIFIDGNHLFDYTLLDFFFAVKLLNIGGVIILNDIRYENTGKAYKYFKTNYQNLVEGKNTYNASQAFFVKIAEDNRPWFFHIDF